MTCKLGDESVDCFKEVDTVRSWHWGLTLRGKYHDVSLLSYTFYTDFSTWTKMNTNFGVSQL